MLLVAGPSDANTSLLGRFNIPSEEKRYGGLSALHMNDAGTGFLAMSDRGEWFTGTVVRNADGAIVDLTVTPPQRIKTTVTKGNDRPSRDSEGLAIGPDGEIYVSFEGVARVSRFDNLDGSEMPLPRVQDFKGLQGNAGLEALAIDADGALYTIPERSGRFDRPFPVFRYQDGQWTIPFEIPRTESYLIVGADFGPDGQLYILERDFNGIGFYSRVRRIDLAAGTAETLLETGLGVHGNLEGISIWENAAGDTIMTLIADNNFRRLLTNEIAEYRIDG